jgi:hypothetical protein
VSIDADGGEIRAGLYGLAGEFETPEAMREAVRALVEAGYRCGETYTPFAVEGVAEEFRLRRTWMAPTVGIAALCGASGAFFMQWFANVVHYPWIVGGKPANSWPMWIPITFEGAILCGAVTGVVAMVVRNGLPRLYHPMFRIAAFRRASRDRFFVCVEAEDPKFEVGEVARVLSGCGAVAVMEVPR